MRSFSPDTKARKRASAALVIFVAFAALTACATTEGEPHFPATAVVSGEFIVEPPTLIALGFELLPE